jgi:hypothetical protein
VRDLGAALVFLAAFVSTVNTFPAFALDSDDGPSRAVAAVRHDLPILLADSLAYYEVRAVPVIEWVVTDGRQAVAEWRADQTRGVVVLRFRSGRWWWRGAASTPIDRDTDKIWTWLSVPGKDLSFCGGSKLGPPSARDLLTQGFIDKSLAARVSGRLGPTPQTGVVEIATCDSFGERWEGNTTDGYAANFFHPKDDLPVRFTLNGRGPADWQRPSRRDSELYYVFRLSAQKPAAAKFTAGSTFDVWFPFVLDTKKVYRLRISHIVPDFQVAPRSTKNNVLHFVLPAFEIHEGSTALGEVDAESP